MNLEKKKINTFLSKSKKIINSRNEFPINDIKIKVTEKSFDLSCTNLKYWFKASIPFEEGFAIDSFDFNPTLYSIKEITRVLKLCKGLSIEVKKIENNIYFNTEKLNKSENSIMDYPDDIFNHNNVMLLGTISNFDLFKRAHEFLSDDDTRYFMKGIHFVLKDKAVVIEATNGRVCTKSESNFGTFEGIQTEEMDFIAPNISAFFDLELKKFSVEKNMMCYYNDIFSLQTKLIDGQFPNVDRVYPDYENSHYKAVFDREKVCGAIDTIAADFKYKKIKPDKMTFEFDSKEISGVSLTREQSLTVDLGFDVKTVKRFSYFIFKQMMYRNHDFDLWIPNDNSNNFLPYVVVDKVFKTKEVFMGMQL